MASEKVFKLTESRTSWQILFPELGSKATGQLVLAEKKEANGDIEASLKHLDKAIVYEAQGL